MSTRENLNIKSTNTDLLKDFTLVKQGAEAKLYTGVFENKSTIVKERFKKTYRHPDLDKSLTTKRIKNEVKLLNKASTLGIKVPQVYKVDIPNGLIYMEFIDDSLTCREYIIQLVNSGLKDVDVDKKLVKMSTRVGNIIGKLHYNQVIHGDLTTSNMLLKKSTLINDNNDQEELMDIYLIDFGLSVVSPQLEDKAVDLYVLERALASTHSQHAKFIFDNILKGYEFEYKTNFDQVLDRLNQVRLRGRKRSMIG